jgi:diadenosine tetraphosphate (Ap4A) HIT family hydrolase
VATLFTRIIDGELPGRFVWSDDHCVAFLTIAPISQGHTLVVPRREVDHWLDADPDLLVHLTGVAQTIGLGVDRAFSPRRVATLIAGFEVPHLHIHVLGAASEHDLKFENADPGVAPERLDEDMAQLRAALVELGHGATVPD